MDKNNLKYEFLKYQLTLKNGEQDYTHKHIALLEKFSDNFAFMRNCFDDGHFTASTFVVNYEYTKILLMHHIKFDRWQQFGGHADGEIDLICVAKRELQEESGIQMRDIKIWDDILELDIHEVPEKGIEPVHLHYDVRYIAVVDENIALNKADDEVHAIAWFKLDDVITSRDIKFQSSMKNALQKIKLLHQK